jgi:flagellar protein FliT
MATMHRMPSQIELYEEMSLLSSRMVEAARAGNWDSLIELERDVSGLRNILMATPEDSNVAATDQARKSSLIQSILKDDAEVRRHTEPWMEHLRQYLGDSTRRRDVQQASGESASGSFGA